MSAASLPYHLRPNKYIDRLLFVELLEIISRWRPLGDYLYASMGGIHLADHQLVHNRLAIQNLLSFDANETVVTRQKFNRPYQFIDCMKQTSGEFIADFDEHLERSGSSHAIVWLDYTNMDLYEQLEEFEGLISKLSSGDVVKITINATAGNFTNDQENPYSDPDKLHEAIEEKLKDKLPRNIDKDGPLTSNSFPRLLARTIELAAKRGIQYRSATHIVRPLTVLSYKDGQGMLTVTSIILKQTEQSSFTSRTRIADWEYYCKKKWEDYTKLQIPDLSIKERAAIDELINEDPGTIRAGLPFRLSPNSEKEEEMIDTYKAHYRRYPSFARFLI